MANSGQGAGKTNISSVTVQGTGLLDDYVVTPQDVFADTPLRRLVKVTSEGAGTVYPGGNLLVPDGTANLTIQILPAPDSVIGDVWVNGSSIGAPTQYTFTSVTADQTLHVVFADLYTSEHRVPVSWMTDNALGGDQENGNADGDVMLNWEEYVAGTDPQDSNSVFEVINVFYGGTYNRVTWYGTTNSGVTIPFNMWRTTNLLDQGAWELIEDASIPRSADGTNVWDDLAPPNRKSYYQPSISWPY
jgi:hypothetical protein